MGEFVMPTLGADMSAGTLIAWCKQPGDTVARGDIIAEVHTDKADIEVEVFSGGVVGITIMAVAEALTLAKKAGVDPAKVRTALLGGFAQSRILDLHGQRMLDHNFQPGFRIRLHEKDLSIALATGKAYGVPLFNTALVHEVMTALMAQGHQDLDHSGIARFVEELSGLEG